MGAKARKIAVKEVGAVANARSRPPALARFWTWALPHINTFVHESAKSTGRQMGPALKWLLITTVTSGGLVAAAKIVTEVLPQ